MPNITDIPEKDQDLNKEKVSPIYNAIKLTTEKGVKLSKNIKADFKTKHNCIWDSLHMAWFCPIASKSKIETLFITSGIDCKIEITNNPKVDLTALEKSIEGMYTRRDILAEKIIKDKDDLLIEVVKYDELLRPSDFDLMPDTEGKSELEIKFYTSFHEKQTEIKALEKEAKNLELSIKEAESAEEPIRDLIVKALNEEFAIVQRPKPFIINHKEKKFWSMTKQAFMDLLQNKRIPKGFSDESEAEVFLNHKDRMTYKEITMNPEIIGNYDGLYNLWKGFAVKPQQEGCCDRYKEHLKTVICGSNVEAYEYLWKLLATWIQFPAKRTCGLLMRGDEGQGKGTFVKPLQMIFGDAFERFAGLDELFGKYNGRIANKILIFADEALFTGDRSQIAKIKSMITEETYSVEEKYQPVLNLPNYRKVIVASNFESALPIGAKDRRFFCLDTSSKKNSDDYFTLLYSEILEGGAEALLYDLAKTDLTNFNPFAKPKNADAFETKLKGSPSAIQFLYHCLENSSLSYSIQWSDINPLEIRKSEFRNCYRDFMDGNRSKKELQDDASITKQLNKMFDGIEGFNPRARTSREEGQKPIYRLPNLLNSQKAFAASFECEPESIFTYTEHT